MKSKKQVSKVGQPFVTVCTPTFNRRSKSRLVNCESGAPTIRLGQRQPGADMRIGIGVQNAIGGRCDLYFMRDIHTVRMDYSPLEQFASH
jgi:hypothetical protein